MNKIPPMCIPVFVLVILSLSQKSLAAPSAEEFVSECFRILDTTQPLNKTAYPRFYGRNDYLQDAVIPLVDRIPSLIDEIENERLDLTKDDEVERKVFLLQALFEHGIESEIIYDRLISDQMIVGWIDNSRTPRIVPEANELLGMILARHALGSLPGVERDIPGPTALKTWLMKGVEQGKWRGGVDSFLLLSVVATLKSDSPARQLARSEVLGLVSRFAPLQGGVNGRHYFDEAMYYRFLRKIAYELPQTSYSERARSRIVELYLAETLDMRFDDLMGHFQSMPLHRDEVFRTIADMSVYEPKMKNFFVDESAMLFSRAEQETMSLSNFDFAYLIYVQADARRRDELAASSAVASDQIPIEINWTEHLIAFTEIDSETGLPITVFAIRLPSSDDSVLKVVRFDKPERVTSFPKEGEGYEGISQVVEFGSRYDAIQVAERVPGYSRSMFQAMDSANRFLRETEAREEAARIREGSVREGTPKPK